MFLYPRWRWYSFSQHYPDSPACCSHGFGQHKHCKGHNMQPMVRRHLYSVLMRLRYQKKCTRPPLRGEAPLLLPCSDCLRRRHHVSARASKAILTPRGTARPATANVERTTTATYGSTARRLLGRERWLNRHLSARAGTGRDAEGVLRPKHKAAQQSIFEGRPAKAEVAIGGSCSSLRRMRGCTAYF